VDERENWTFVLIKQKLGVVFVEMMGGIVEY
jgi:hypothetical protein